MSSTTRIVDLPDMQQQQNMGGGMGFGGTTAYVPIDVHPNPYGHPPPSAASMPSSSSTSTKDFNMNNMFQQMQQQQPQQSQPQYQQPLQQSGGLPVLPQQKLASRDVQIDPTMYAQDEQIQVNYIPPVAPSAKLKGDFLKHHDEMVQEELEKHSKQKTRERNIDQMIETWQIPFFVAILFFIFHMPIVNRLLFKHLAFLSIYDADGNFNIYGLLLKSAFFGGSYYVFTQLTEFISSL